MGCSTSTAERKTPGKSRGQRGDNFKNRDTYCGDTTNFWRANRNTKYRFSQPSFS